MDKNDLTLGWVLIDETHTAGHLGPQFYLVAAESEQQALHLAHNKLGDAKKIAVRGSAPVIHLERRNMKPGDIYAI